MSRTKPPDDFRPEESPIAWFGEMLVALDLGDFDRAAHSQHQLDRLGWLVTRKRSRPTACQAARLEAMKHDASLRLDGTMKLESRRSCSPRLAGPAVRVSLKYNRRILMGNIVIDATIIWDLEDEPDGNVQHIAEHGVTVDEVEEVLHDPRSRVGRSRRSGRPQTFGWTSTGKFIAVIWEEVSDDPRMIYPITAYEVPPPQGRQK
jgi:uncharacterized DUF497 family protein